MKQKAAFYGFSISAYKRIAMLSMLVDHVAAVVLKGYMAVGLRSFSEDRLARWWRIYEGMRFLGRMAFPLFVFCLVEGFFHTRSRERYAARLLLLACLSEIPFDLSLYGSVITWQKQNVMFTLLFCLLTLWGMEAANRLQKGYPLATIGLQALAVALGAGIAFWFRCDYSYKGILLAVIFYLFHGYRWAAAAGGYAVNMWWEVNSFPAFLLLPFYSGKKGKKSGHGLYLFYPVHLLLLYGVLLILVHA